MNTYTHKQRASQTQDPHTIRMPHLPQKPHRGWIQRVILRELEFGREDATFEGGAVRSLDQSFPEEDVVFGDGAGGDAVGGGGGEEFVFVEEAAGCYCGGHVWWGVWGRKRVGLGGGFWHVF